MSWIERAFYRRSVTKVDFLNFGGLVVASWAGMRGVVSLAAALALPLTLDGGEPFPHRHIILFLTFCVIFVTLVLQGLSLPWLARRLRVEEESTEYQSEADARMLLTGELVEEIAREMKKTTDSHERESLELWRGYYQARLDNLKVRHARSPEINRKSARHERAFFPRLIEHTRNHLAAMRRDGLISEEVRRKIEYDFDLEEQRIQRVLARHN